MLTPDMKRVIEEQRLGFVATAAPDGTPNVLPMGTFAVLDDRTIQTEFAKSAFETFVTESQKIGALYTDLAKQTYKPFGGFVTKATSTE